MLMFFGQKIPEMGGMGISSIEECEAPVFACLAETTVRVAVAGDDVISRLEFARSPCVERGMEHEAE